jgi:hypothetical protein
LVRFWVRDWRRQGWHGAVAVGFGVRDWRSQSWNGGARVWLGRATD